MFLQISLLVDISSYNCGVSFKLLVKVIIIIIEINNIWIILISNYFYIIHIH